MYILIAIIVLYLNTLLIYCLCKQIELQSMLLHSSISTSIKAVVMPLQSTKDLSHFDAVYQLQAVCEACVGSHEAVKATVDAWMPEQNAKASNLCFNDGNEMQSKSSSFLWLHLSHWYCDNQLHLIYSINDTNSKREQAKTKRKKGRKKAQKAP